MAGWYPGNKNSPKITPKQRAAQRARFRRRAGLVTPAV